YLRSTAFKILTTDDGKRICVVTIPNIPAREAPAAVGRAGLQLRDERCAPEGSEYRPHDGLDGVLNLPRDRRYLEPLVSHRKPEPFQLGVAHKREVFVV